MSTENQIESARHRISKLEKQLDAAKDELEKEIELKNKYLDSCKNLRAKFNLLKKELQNEVKEITSPSKKDTRKQSRS